MGDQITTQRYTFGQYTFVAQLPKISFSTDVQSWRAKVGDEWLVATYPTLEDAMLAAVAEKRASISKADTF